MESSKKLPNFKCSGRRIKEEQKRETKGYNIFLYIIWFPSLLVVLNLKTCKGKKTTSFCGNLPEEVELSTTRIFTSLWNSISDYRTTAPCGQKSIYLSLVILDCHSKLPSTTLPPSTYYSTLDFTHVERFLSPNQPSVLYESTNSTLCLYTKNSLSCLELCLSLSFSLACLFPVSNQTQITFSRRIFPFRLKRYKHCCSLVGSACWERKYS